MSAAVAIVVALHVEELGELSLLEAMPVIAAVEKELDALAGIEAVLDDPSFGCESAERCAEEVRARSGAAEVVMLRAVAGPTRMQLRLRRLRDGAPPREAEGLIERTPAREALAALVRTLYPEAAALPRIAEEISPPLRLAEPARTDTGPPILAGGLIALGLAGGVVGVVFAQQNADARRTVRENVLIDTEYRAARDRARSRGIAADVLIPAGASVLAAGLVILAIDLL